MARRPTRLNPSTSSSIDFAENMSNFVYHSPTRSSKSSFAPIMQRWCSRSVSHIKLLMICFLVVSITVLVITQVRNPEEHEQQTNNLILDNTELLNALYELPIPTTQLELDEVNDELKELHPLYILQWAYHATHEQNELVSKHPLVQVTSFGLTGLVILDLILSQLHLDVPIITMDTLHLFPETYDFYKTIISEREDMNLIITKPLGINTQTDFQTKYGSSLYKTDPKKFTQLTKIDPLNKQLDELNVQMWISGRRRSQGGERSHIPVLEFEYFSEVDIEDENDDFDISNGRWKLNPLAYWTYDQVWNYIKTNKLSYNTLYDKGYTSIGDTMTTTLPQFNATTSGSQNGDDYERSGRFVGMNKTECGLHSVRAKRQQAKEDGVVFNAPTLVCGKCIDTNTDNFIEVITTGEKEDEVLFEFYSPYCGGCQAFAPTLNRIANHISSNIPNSKVVRFDITEEDIPQIDGKDVFKVETTPTLYRVRYSPSFQVEFYTGDHEFDSIIEWFSK